MTHDSNTPTQIPPQTLAELALAAFKAGRLAESERLVRDALLADAHNADACELLGAAYATRKDFAAALPLFSRAVELVPSRVQFHFN